MKNIIDLHVHTTASGGTCSPMEVVDEAMALGLRAIAITDHDSIHGLESAMEYAADKDIRIIPGVELTTMSDIYHSVYDRWETSTLSSIDPDQRFMVLKRPDLTQVHILGYNMDYKDLELIHILDYLSLLRNDRISLMAEALAKDFPEVSMKEIRSMFPGATLTRSNLAVYLQKLKIVDSVKEAFDNLIGEDCIYYVHKKKMTDEGAIALIKYYGGIPVLAHPVQYKTPEGKSLSETEYNLLFDNLTALGIEGVEAIYSENLDGDQERFTAMAKERGLFITGGSDYHGTAKPDIHLGRGINNNLFIPETVLDNLI
ncbi:MAG: PHP domain-containing protein [Lachnospiraceae bacterium]|nr:PHP domain-containing protein [Lachnospiraceae bacterium]